MKEHIAIERLPADFHRWQELLDLINGAFAYMDGIIDPPSSAKRLTAANLAQKARDEVCFIASDSDRLVGCAFAAARPECLYVGKIAVAQDMQGRGIGKALMRAAEKLARACGKPFLELQTRIELVANQMAFARLGFRETGRTAHAGYDRPTSITMRKAL
jgi:GNAT superfamily N-acetyltransferase